MRILIYVLVGVIALLMVLCYSLCVIASEAAERVDRKDEPFDVHKTVVGMRIDWMAGKYDRKWKESRR